MVGARKCLGLVDLRYFKTPPYCGVSVGATAVIIMALFYGLLGAVVRKEIQITCAQVFASLPNRALISQMQIEHGRLLFHPVVFSNQE